MFRDRLTGGAKPAYHTPPYPSYPLLLYSVMTASYWPICMRLRIQIGRFNSAQTISRFSHSGQRGSRYSISLNSVVVMNSAVSIMSSCSVMGFTTTALMLCLCSSCAVKSSISRRSRNSSMCSNRWSSVVIVQDPVPGVLCKEFWKGTGHPGGPLIRARDESPGPPKSYLIYHTMPTST